MRSHIRRLLESAGFSPKQLFAALQGAWLEPKQGLIWQENTGVTPTTTGGQTIGLLLDQSQGAVLGPELVTNGDFSGGTTGWIANGKTLAIVAGELEVTSTGSGGPYQLLSLQSGKQYLCSFSGRIGTTTSIQVLAQDTGPGGASRGASGVISSNTPTTYTFWITASTAPVSIYLRLSATGTAYFDNISVREILGNHGHQSVAANRPTYQLDSNNLPLARHDTTDSLTVSLPDLGGGVFSNAGSVYFATPVGMSAIHNQSIGTSYNLPALQSDIYGYVLTPERLSAVNESRLERYMLRLSGLAGADYFEQEDYGPELVTNGDFSNGTTGWSVNPDWAVENNEVVRKTNSGANGIIQFNILSVGKYFRWSINVKALSGGDTRVLVFIGGTLTTFFSSGIKTGTTLCTTAQTLYIYSTANNCTLDDISVRELKDGITGQLTSDDSVELLLAQ